MSQVYKSLASGPTPPAIATSYVTDSGTAVPAANVLTVLGGAGCATSASGSTITVTVDGTAPTYVNVTTAMSPYTVLATDYFISCDSTLGVITILLPNAPTTYDRFVVKDRTGTADTLNIIVTTVGGIVNIDGVPSYVCDEEYESIEVLFNSTSYEIF